MEGEAAQPEVVVVEGGESGNVQLRAPFPYFGGKSKVASLVWQRFGDVKGYVEPFFGSGAVLLARLGPYGTETVNDADRFIANFWRSTQADPDAVAYHADWPVNEVDLYARHLWLVNEGAARLQSLEDDPHHYDAQVAGWWLWGISQWIGSGWCASANPSRKRPHLSSAGTGVHRKLPSLGDAGRGVHRRVVRQVQHIAGGGKGVHRASIGLGVEERSRWLLETIYVLRDRLRNVRVCCGDWSRVLGPSVTTKRGLTAVFLDPPYALSERHAEIYTVESDCASAVRDWAVANGDNPLFRIALCSYGDQPCPDGWERVLWKANGGYGVQGNGRGRENAHREAIDFSPHCHQTGARQLGLRGFEI